MADPKIYQFENSERKVGGLYIPLPNTAAAVCPVCGAPVSTDSLVFFCGHDANAVRKCAA